MILNVNILFLKRLITYWHAKAPPYTDPNGYMEVFFCFKVFNIRWMT